MTFKATWKLDVVRRDGEEPVATIHSDYGDGTREQRFDQVIVNHGTRPLDDLYFDLRAGSTNLGEVDYDALVESRPQQVRTNAADDYQLFRIGDIVAARNTPAAIYDAFHLMRTI